MNSKFFPQFSCSFPFIIFSEWCLWSPQWTNNGSFCKYLFHSNLPFEQITYFNSFMNTSKLYASFFCLTVLLNPIFSVKNTPDMKYNSKMYKDNNTLLFLLTVSLVTWLIYCVDRNRRQFCKLHYLLYPLWAFWTLMEVTDFTLPYIWFKTGYNNLCHQLAQKLLKVSLTPFYSVSCSLSELLESKEDHIDSLFFINPPSSSNFVMRVELCNSRPVTCTAFLKMWKCKNAKQTSLWIKARIFVIQIFANINSQRVEEKVFGSTYKSCFLQLPTLLF